MIRFSELEKVNVLQPLEVYSCRLELGDLRNKFIKIIDAEGDRQNRSTNIKADMTDWRLNDRYSDFSVIEETFIAVYKKILEIYNHEFYKQISEFYSTDRKIAKSDIWGARYRSREKTVPHNHHPSIMSMCLYLKTPKGCPGLSFNEISRTIPVSENQMIIFNPSIIHSVKSKKFRGQRYVLAANIVHIDR